MNSEIVGAGSKSLIVDESGLLAGRIADPGKEEWPANGLETVGACPVCGCAEREVLYRDLQDRVFFCAPGKWTLHKCHDCGSAYLDPRPTPETIGFAYRRYLTHSSTEIAHPFSNFRGWIRRALANGYRNHRFGTKEQPASKLGIFVAFLFPSLRAVADTGMRSLPRLPATGGRVLDVGCGNGDFLARAKSAGWEVSGVDPDPEALNIARVRNLDVRLGGIETVGCVSEQFDVITLSHVLEHVHDPVALLRRCYQLLKPGGWVWLETPNLAGRGHDRYGIHWLPLDTPRHLVLFNPRSLRDLLADVGFERITHEPYRPLCPDSFAFSEAIAQGRDPARARKLSSIFRRSVWIAEGDARRDPGAREFLTIRGWKAAG